jgi:hypothetical protein
MKMLKAIATSGLYLAVICWCLGIYYRFISSKTDEREFAIFLSLSMVFLLGSIYARKRLKALNPD